MCLGVKFHARVNNGRSALHLTCMDRCGICPLCPGLDTPSPIFRSRCAQDRILAWPEHRRMPLVRPGGWRRIREEIRQAGRVQWQLMSQLAPIEAVVSHRLVEPDDATARHTHLLSVIDPRQLVADVQVSELALPLADSVDLSAGAADNGACDDDLIRSGHRRRERPRRFRFHQREASPWAASSEICGTASWPARARLLRVLAWRPAGGAGAVRHAPVHPVDYRARA